MGGGAGEIYSFFVMFDGIRRKGSRLDSLRLHRLRAKPMYITLRLYYMDIATYISYIVTV